MPSRHKQRQRALQILFQWDARRQPVDDCLRAYYDSLYSEENEQSPAPEEFVEQLVRGVANSIEAVDEMIGRHAANWRIPRMPAVDRNVLRLAVYEMRELSTPPPVVIDEAIELARRFSGEDSVHFVNGVLDAVRRELGTGAQAAPAS